MNIEETIPGDSFLHQWDPRAKLVAAALFSVIVAINRSPSAGAVALLFPAVLVGIAGLPLGSILRRLIPVNVFVAFLWLFLPFSFSGEVIHSIGPLDIYGDGVRQALLITLKSNAIVLMLVALLRTSSVFDIVHGMSHLGMPDKLVHLFFFSLRYIHVIHKEYVRLVQAARIRGFRARTNLRTYRTYAYILGMLLARSYDRSERIVEAMKCRGFKGRFYILSPHNMKNSDYLLAGLGALFSCALLFIPA